MISLTKFDNDVLIILSNYLFFSYN